MTKKVYHTRSTFFALIVIMLLVSSSGPVLAGDDATAIDKVRLDFNAAFNEGNTQAISGLIDDNCIWLPPGKPSIVGKDKIVADYANHFAKVRSQFELKPSNIQVCGGWAFMCGDFTRVDTPKAGGTAQRVSGHYLFVLKKQPDGKWKITRDIWSDSIQPKVNSHAFGG